MNRHAVALCFIFLSREAYSDCQTTFKALIPESYLEKIQNNTELLLLHLFPLLFHSVFRNKSFISCRYNLLVSKLLECVCNLSYPCYSTVSQINLQPLWPCLWLCFSSLRLTALPQVECVSRVTVTRLVPSRLTVMKPVSVGVSRASPDPNVTGAHEDSSTSRRAAAHVSRDSGVEKGAFL